MFKAYKETGRNMNANASLKKKMNVIVLRHFSGDHRRLTSFDSLFLFTTEPFNFF